MEEIYQNTVAWSFVSLCYDPYETIKATGLCDLCKKARGAEIDYYLADPIQSATNLSDELPADL